MALAQEDLDYIKGNLGSWLAEQSLARPPVVYEIELRERIVRVEEALKNQHELTQSLIQQMEKRFEQMDKRFEKMQAEMDRRFAQVEKRFDVLTTRVDRFMLWSFGTTISVAGLLFAALRFWPPGT